MHLFHDLLTLDIISSSSAGRIKQPNVLQMAPGGPSLPMPVFLECGQSPSGPPKTEPVAAPPHCSMVKPGRSVAV